METHRSETRISGQFAAYDNDGTIKMLLDIITILAQQILAWIDEPHRNQVHVVVAQVVKLMPLLIELVSQIIVLVLLLIEICGMVLKVMLLVEAIINAFLDWCESVWKDVQFMRTGELTYEPVR